MMLIAEVICFSHTFEKVSKAGADMTATITWLGTPSSNSSDLLIARPFKLRMRAGQLRSTESQPLCNHA
eukprot:CAMPEP_0170627200 /NCGR_PEP_ID=MMETSP0224-20130122/31830_1 /TAXON_ID=285029 /ORGANISM="Togula jolla, Strain CCCM 725" /LENGTH=68 /DNA_ID=CAMNT_0010954155 /DNA_START=83 /DNA_END=289 /DNA_ORIENTATION=-